MRNVRRSAVREINFAARFCFIAALCARSGGANKLDLESCGSGCFEFEFEREAAVFFDGDFFLQDAGFAVMGLNGVSAGREVIQNEVSVLVGDGKEGMFDHVDIGEFPRMHVALEAEETFGLGEGEFERSLTGQEGAILVGTIPGHDVHVVNGVVAVLHEQRLVCLNRDDVVFVKATAQAKGDGFFWHAPILPG